MQLNFLRFSGRLPESSMQLDAAGIVDAVGFSWIFRDAAGIVVAAGCSWIFAVSLAQGSDIPVRLGGCALAKAFRMVDER